MGKQKRARTRRQVHVKHRGRRNRKGLKWFKTEAGKRWSAAVAERFLALVMRPPLFPKLLSREPVPEDSPE